MAEAVRLVAGDRAQVHGGEQQAQRRQHGQPRRGRTHLAARPADRVDSMADRLEQKLPLRKRPAGREAGQHVNFNDNHYQVQLKGKEAAQSFRADVVHRVDVGGFCIASGVATALPVEAQWH